MIYQGPGQDLDSRPVMFLLIILGATVAINQWQTTWVNIHLARVTAKIMAWIMRLLGQGGLVSGITITTDVCKFRIIGECTAYYPISIYIAAVLAFPTTPAKKAIGLGVGIPLLYLFNVLRILVLIVVGRYQPSIFEFMHVYFWQATLILMITSVWLLWIFKVVRHETVAAPRT